MSHPTCLALKSASKSEKSTFIRNLKVAGGQHFKVLAYQRDSMRAHLPTWCHPHRFTPQLVTRGNGKNQATLKCTGRSAARHLGWKMKYPWMHQSRLQMINYYEAVWDSDGIAQWRSRRTVMAKIASWDRPICGAHSWHVSQVPDVEKLYQWLEKADIWNNLN